MAASRYRTESGEGLPGGRTPRRTAGHPSLLAVSWEVVNALATNWRARANRTRMVPMRVSPRLRGPNAGAMACLLLVHIIACASPTTLHWFFSPPLHLTRRRSPKGSVGRM
jgi:hypothetical protein